MKIFNLTIFLVGASLLLSGCVTSRAATASIAKQSMVGMSKESVLSCMGVPVDKMTEGSTEVWVYGSGGGTDSIGSAFGQTQGSAHVIGNSVYGSSSGSAIGFGRSRSRYCTINMVFQKGRVSAVNYSGRTGGLATQGEQCAYAIENCVH
ncbi:MAG TPA: hypothetical protein PK389_04310 [Gammaproteobacteria bacterium]|nr:hypothetical protein [Micavibrio sp.]MBK9562984.1 hypothetical protein [Micavibrio sp.]HQY22958.1 hypothetical protein [Gammaproteobacteria bacterium]